MSGARHRQKGNRAEREIVDLHRGSGHDIDLYPFGREAAPLVAEVKARKDGAGFVQLEKWLAEFDALFLRRNNANPLVLLPWRVWVALLTKIPRGGAA